MGNNFRLCIYNYLNVTIAGPKILLDFSFMVIDNLKSSYIKFFLEEFLLDRLEEEDRCTKLEYTVTRYISEGYCFEIPFGCLINHNLSLTDSAKPSWSRVGQDKVTEKILATTQFSSQCTQNTFVF